ncbi:MAG TPA: hypothetical protein VGE41_07090 [Verrucomicrobiae bacterium]
MKSQHGCAELNLLYPVDDPNDIAGEQPVQFLSGTGAFVNRVFYPFPTLLLLDLKMPRRGGFEALGWIRGNPPIRCLPVVILTSSRNE